MMAFFCQICFQLFGRSFEEGNEYDLLLLFINSI